MGQSGASGESLNSSSSNIISAARHLQASLCFNQCDLWQSRQQCLKILQAIHFLSLLSSDSTLPQLAQVIFVVSDRTTSYDMVDASDRGDRYSPIMLKVEDGLSCTNERKMFRSWKFSTEESVLIYFILAPSVSAAAVHACTSSCAHQRSKPEIFFI